MFERIVNLPNAIPPSRIVIQDFSPEVIAAIGGQMRKCLAGVGIRVVDLAREKGSYNNRTGNLRRFITPNKNRAQDDVKSYAHHDIRVVEADGVAHTRQQYNAPEGFDTVVVEDRGEELVVTIADIMWYAAALEARGYIVLTGAVQELITNAGEIMGQEIRMNDLTDRRTKSERIAEEGQ